MFISDSTRLRHVNICDIYGVSILIWSCTQLQHTIHETVEKIVVHYYQNRINVICRHRPKNLSISAPYNVLFINSNVANIEKPPKERMTYEIKAFVFYLNLMIKFGLANIIAINVSYSFDTVEHHTHTTWRAEFQNILITAI